MLICHKLVASNGVEVLQAWHMSDVHATSTGTGQCLQCQHRERLCACEHLIQSHLALLVSQTPILGSYASPPPPLHEAVVVPMKTACMQSK